MGFWPLHGKDTQPWTAPEASEPKPEEEPGIVEHDASCEAWREYSWQGPYARVFCRIWKPVYLHFLRDGSEHYVISEDGITHVVPAPGHFGCVCRWQMKESERYGKASEE